MGGPAARPTVEEYLALEASSETKHEFLNGEIVAMAGATLRHNLICTNIGASLATCLRESPCRVVGSDQRVCISLAGAYLYPDVSVVCAEPRFGSDRPPSLLNPMIVIEVLSSSTADRDRGPKLAHYRRLASIREVLLVEANERRAELYRRLENGQWLLTDIVEGDVQLASIDARLSLDAIYAKVDGLPIDEA